MDTTSPIRALINEARSSLSKLEEKAVILRVQIEAYEKALNALNPSKSSFDSDSKPRSVNLSAALHGNRKRTLPPLWAKVLKYIGNFPDGLKADKIYDWSQAQEIGIERNNLRSQLHNYCTSGILERVSPGVFRLTDYGSKLVNVTSNSDSMEQLVA